MEENDRFRLLNLSYFVNALLLPQLELARLHTLGAPFAAAKIAALFEVVSWLRLGADLAFFPKDGASQLLAQYADEVIPPTPNAWRDLKGLLSEQRDVLNLMEVRAGEILSVRGSSEQPFDNPSELLPLFRSALLLGTKIAIDNRARSFTFALGFLPDVPWKELILDCKIDPNQVALAEGIGAADVSPYIPELVYAGFFRALDNMDALRTLFEECADRESLGDDVARLRSRVLAIVGWRFNASGKRNRFIELVEKINLGIAEEMVARGLYGSSQGGVFRDRALYLMRYWNEEEEMIAHGAAAKV
jgi:hypothetical protein